MNQKTEWGHINWIHTQNDENPRQSFSVGITCVLPGKSLQEHIHYGIDQFLYILDGEGIYIINGVEKKFKKGMFFYLEADTSHTTINKGKTPVREFMVSHPVSYDSEINIDSESLEKDYKTADLSQGNLIYSAIEAIRMQLLETISLPFTIYDEMWSIVIQNNKFPAYCNEMCDPKGNTKYCNCMLQKDFNDLDIEEGAQLTCEYGLSVFHYPIMYNGKQLGSIRGGHILISDLTTTDHDELYDSPRSTIIGIQSLLKQIVRSISSYCTFNTSRNLLVEKDKSLREVLSSNEILEKSLNIVNDKVTNLRINHHFLFNTLNSLASMSLSGDRYDLYEAIINLSKMFRYTMTVDLNFVSLDAEIEYLETYLNLQRLRYVSQLEVQYYIDQELINMMVPFNFLQPVVENAFTHGFSPSDDKKIIKIIVRKSEDTAIITIINNGIPLNQVTMNRINKSITSNTGHGLSFIYEKLKSAYSEDFMMKVISNNNGETGVIMYIPIRCEEGKHDKGYYRRR
ncbi:MAG: histidine kinase [Tissierellia bacterium]|nr:histidine kinase [Tissierellia bacterium]